MLDVRELRQIMTALDCASTSKKKTGAGRKPNFENQLVSLGAVEKVLLSFTARHMQAHSLHDLEKLISEAAEEFKNFDDDDDDDNGGLFPFPGGKPKNPA